MSGLIPVALRAWGICSSGDDGGHQSAVTVTLRARGIGSVTDRAQDSAAEFDPNTANNADSQTTTIGPA